MKRRKAFMSEKLRILFIGNSHTYYNDMPAMVARRFREEGENCEVTMIAHGGWYLEQHALEPDVRFNILYGNYDYVVLQEHAHPFGPEDKLFEAVSRMGEWMREAGSRPVIYMTWAQKDDEKSQPVMTAAHREAAKRIEALLAPVGELWWEKRKKDPQTEMYGPDGAHASKDGSEFAAECIWETIRNDRNKREKNN